jgi:hypothetical protein
MGKVAIAEVETPFLTNSGKLFQPRLRQITIQGQETKVEDNVIEKITLQEIKDPIMNKIDEKKKLYEEFQQGKMNKEEFLVKYEEIERNEI